MFKRKVWVYISGYFMFVVKDNFEMNTKVKQMKNICILTKIHKHSGCRLIQSQIMLSDQMQ